MKRYDLVVLGGGNTGLAAAFRVAGAAKRVVGTGIIETVH